MGRQRLKNDLTHRYVFDLAILRSGKQLLKLKVVCRPAVTQQKLLPGCLRDSDELKGRFAEPFESPRLDVQQIPQYFPY